MTKLSPRSGSPCGIPPELLDEAVKAVLNDVRNSIEFCTASNGAVHPYALVHLDRARALYMAEWEEVGIFESQ